MYARDVMSAPVVTARPDTPVKDLATLLATYRISGVPIVDDGGQVVGIVSESDFPRSCGMPRNTKGSAARLSVWPTPRESESPARGWRRSS